LDNAAWGSHVYFETVSSFYDDNQKYDIRPINLNKYSRPDWRSI
jgi:hypothetical protein